MNLADVLNEQVESRPQAGAIIEPARGGDREVRFAELDLRSRRIAARLRQSGISAGDPVLILVPISVELYAVLLAVFRLGALAVFLDPSATRRHWERCCEMHPPRALIATPKAHFLRIISGALRRIPLQFTTRAWVPGATPLHGIGHLEPVRQSEVCAHDTPALLTFTSGSTGLPKAAVRTHGFLLAQHAVLHKHIQLVPGEIDLTTLPIFLLANLASGVTSVIPDADLRKPGAIHPEPVLDQIRRHKVTRTAASPAFFERLLAAPQPARNALGHLRKVFTGGAPVFPRLLDRLSESAPDATVEAVYGSTEAEPIAHLDAKSISGQDREAMRCGNGLLTGRPIPEIRLRVIRDRSKEPIQGLSSAAFDSISLPAGQPGEIVVSGDHVLSGYLHGHGDAETKFAVDGRIWHRTGDAGKMDESGRLWLLGRCEARVHDGRGELYPFAAECVANEEPSVRRAAFVAHMDRRLLVVEPSEGFDDTTLISLKRSLSWAALDEILLVEKLPLDRRHNAKVDYPALRRLLETGKGTPPPIS